MAHRQTTPQQWLIVAEPISPELWRTLLKLPRGSGVLVLHEPSSGQRRRLRHVANLRRLTIAEERTTSAARVHNVRELRRALLSRTPLILLSPIHETRSHPAWKPLPRMRAAALAALGGRKLIALGGMNARRYAKIAQLGLIGWAGISAFRT
jgi:thiamine-phosphate pyrophosphorylase